MDITTKTAEIALKLAKIIEEEAEQNEKLDEYHILCVLVKLIAPSADVVFKN